MEQEFWTFVNVGIFYPSNLLLVISHLACNQYLNMEITGDYCSLMEPFNTGCSIPNAPRFSSLFFCSIVGMWLE